MRQKTSAASSRRQVLIGAALGLCAVAAVWGGRAVAADKLSYFTWSGYELPDFHKAYEAAHPDSLDVAMFGDDDEAFTKVKAGFRPDLAHPCYDKVERWRQAGLIEPIDTKRLKNWSKISPVLRNLPGLVEGDQTWMVPWDWGNTSITYRTDLLKNPEQSWKLLWDAKYTGKIATIDAVHDTPMVAGLLAGFDPFDMNDDQIEATRKKLQEQRPLLKMYTTDMTSIEQALASGELVAAMTWNASAVSLKKQGVPVEFMNPKEGMLTWVCGFVMIKGTPHADLAYDFINARLADASGEYLIENYGYGSSNADAMKAVGEAKLKELQLPTDPDTMLKATVFTRPIRNNDKITKMFEEVKAGG
ncbi:ABC transporter substrate-binding protein [Dongia soli]|uniref:ABC transporter substrate-binding protein n=1 Tax=Dongia soli TaxID=600628 RepID=A0ABU5EI95_9PROT|nr:ABC transporter substrate-binding protein [Dongia soli]MDY0885564.1 ABC transporter substrate-binding protein [Dongia soli]